MEEGRKGGSEERIQKWEQRRAPGDIPIFSTLGGGILSTHLALALLSLEATETWAQRPLGMAAEPTRCRDLAKPPCL